MSINPMVNQLIDRIVTENSDELEGLDDSLKNACILKHKEIIIETLKED